MKEDKKERDPIWELILGYIGILFGFLILSMGFNMLWTVISALFK
jgi:hypothetical protein